MPWPYSCAVCHSKDIQSGVNEVTCLKCGRLTDKDGVPVPLDVQFHSEDAAGTGDKLSIPARYLAPEVPSEAPEFTAEAPKIEEAPEVPATHTEES